MEVRLNRDSQIAEVWLNRREQADAAVQTQLKPLYAAYKKKGYLVAVFLSGDQDLYQQTTDLLKYNRKRAAQREVAQEKLRQAMI